MAQNQSQTTTFTFRQRILIQIMFDLGVFYHSAPALGPAALVLCRMIKHPKSNII